jgi:hypothetical protein
MMRKTLPPVSFSESSFVSAAVVMPSNAMAFHLSAVFHAAVLSILKICPLHKNRRDVILF